MNPYSTEGKIIISRLRSMPQYVELDRYKCRREAMLEIISTVVGTALVTLLTGGLIIAAAIAEGVM